MEAFAEHVKKFNPISFSVVVIANDHNPTILNPDFLRTNNIIPSDYAVKNTVTTPPFSTVEYENGITISVEIDKLQVINNISNGLDTAETAVKIASE